MSSTRISGSIVNIRRRPINERIGWELKRNYQLYLLILLPVAYIIIFAYMPMYGIQLAFQNYKSGDVIGASPWVGFAQFSKFFHYYNFKRIFTNTLILGVYSLAAGFPFSVLLALALNTSQYKKYKKTVQMVTYAPYFISTVVMVGLLIQFLSPKFGIVNAGISALGLKKISFMDRADLFSSVYVWSGIWQGTGWGSIIYLAALSAIDPTLHEAAIIDGASRLRRIWHIDLPGIAPTITIMLILSTGGVLNVGFEKVYLMQNDMNRSATSIISTYVYEVSLRAQVPDYSYGTAIGMFNSIINLVLLSGVNWAAARFGQTSLW